MYSSLNEHCPDSTSFTHNWMLERVSNGYWEYWGKGTMISQRCTLCGRVDYIKFTDSKNKETIINEKLWERINSGSS